jgi:hypothetical protein
VNNRKQIRAASQVFNADINNFKDLLSQDQEGFEQHIAEQRSRESKTLEKGMCYWINT